MTIDSSKPDFLPTTTIEALKFRAQLLKKVRHFFDGQGFFEVQTPILSHDVVVDRYLEPVSISKSQLLAGADADQKLWLQTSPEFAMKRLVAAGATAIYQICPAIRAGESGQMHNPEFTMLEWYRAGDDLHLGMERLSQFADEILGCGPATKLTYSQLFQDHIQLDPLTASVQQLVAAAKAHDCDVAISSEENNNDHDNWLNILLSQVIEPKIPPSTPTIVYDWPASQSALAIVRDQSPPVAERFELYFAGAELANGYHELLDANELLKRNQKINSLRVADGVESLPEQSRLLDAMKAGMPACAGVAVGFDRLMMLAMKANSMKVDSIDQVISFPIDRA